MSLSTHYHIEDFTRNNYRRLVKMAKEKYIFRFFSNFAPGERYILWRHDVDFSVHSARKLALIEGEEGVVSTFFLHMHSMFYNLFEKEISDLCFEIKSAGHNLGLHFDPDYYSIQNDDQFRELLTREKKMLEDLLGCKVEAVSFHNPTPEILHANKMEYCGMINAYAEYFHKQVGYCSDSSGYWRHRRLEDVLSAGEDPCLQVLTHPEWWQDEAMLPYQRILRCIEGRAKKTKQNYQAMLQGLGRENVGFDSESETSLD